MCVFLGSLTICLFRVPKHSPKTQKKRHSFLSVSFWLHGCCGSGKVGPVNQVNHTSWVTVVTPTDRPKSVRKRCVIEHFFGVVCVVTLPFWHFFWCRGFCHRTESDLFLFLLYLQCFQQRPFLEFSEELYKFKILAVKAT